MSPASSEPKRGEWVIVVREWLPLPSRRLCRYDHGFRYFCGLTTYPSSPADIPVREYTGANPLPSRCAECRAARARVAARRLWGNG